MSTSTPFEGAPLGSTASLLTLLGALTPTRLNASREIAEEIFSTALCGKGSLSRVLLVGRKSELARWALPGSVNKPSANKKKKQNKAKFAAWCTPAEYRDEADDNIDESVDDGDLVLLLPGQEYRALSILWADDGLQGHVVVAGVGGLSSSDAVLFNDQEDIMGPIVRVGSGAVVCLARVRVELRATSYDGAVNISEGGALRIAGGSIAPQTQVESLGSEEGNFFDGGGVETPDLLSVSHGGSLFLEDATLGPSTSSALHLDGQCCAVLRRCTLRGCGRGNKVQRVDMVRGKGPFNLEGSHPAVGLSWGGTLVLSDCTFENNFGHDLQWNSADEETGTTDRELLDEAEKESPEEYAAKMTQSRSDMCVADAQMAQYFTKVCGHDLTTPTGVAAAVLGEAAARRAELAKVEAKRTRGVVTSSGCRCTDVALSRYYLGNSSNDGAKDGEMLTRPWHQAGTPMRKMIDLSEAGWVPKQDEESIAEAKVWREFLRVGLKRGEEHQTEEARAFALFKPDGSAAAALKKRVSDTQYDYFLTPTTLFRADGRQKVRRYPEAGGTQEREAYARAAISDLKKTKLAFAELDGQSLIDLQGRCVERYEADRAWLRSSDGPLADVLKPTYDPEEFQTLCWGCIKGCGNRHPKSMPALFTTVAHIAASPTHTSLGERRAQILASRLHCDGMADQHREYEDACDCDGEGMAAVRFAVQLLLDTGSVGASRIDSTLVDALLEILGDAANASEHGRTNAAQALAELADRRPELRTTAVEAIAAALVEPLTPNFGAFSRGCLLQNLRDLRAKECISVVRRAFKRQLIDAAVCGGYSEYLVAVGLPVDLDGDSSARKEVANPHMWVQRGESEAALEGKRAARSAEKRSEIASHNARLLSRNDDDRVAADVSVKQASCAHCGVHPTASSGKPSFARCGGCKAVSYCGGVCQKAAWKAGHKRVCAARQAKPVWEAASASRASP